MLTITFLFLGFILLYNMKKVHTQNYIIESVENIMLGLIHITCLKTKVKKMNNVEKT